MNRSCVSMLSALFFLSLILGGCGSEGSDSDDSGGVTPGTGLEVFTGKVKACTPYLKESRPSTGSYGLKEWNGWDPQATDTVLGKLFDPGIGGDECIYTQLEILDSHIELVNTFADEWGTSGTYTKSGITAVVNTDATIKTIPFLGPNFSLIKRLVTLNDSSKGLTVHMAFSQTSTSQVVISQYVQGSESGVYYAEFLEDKVKFWCASVDNHKVQIMWEGNTEQKTFKISECTDAAGLNWEVIGGGSIDPLVDEMAFMARNHATNFSADEYYLAIALGDLEDGDEQEIINAATNPPGATGVLAYITEGNSLCLGFLGVYEYHDNVEDLAWEDD